MSRDRRPPGSRSPFESIGTSGGHSLAPRADITVEMTNTAQPKSPIQSPLEQWAKLIEVEMSSPFSGGFGGDAGRDRLTGVRYAEMPSNRSKAAEDEQRLRGPVEKYLLKTTPGVAWDDVIGNETARTHPVEAIEHPVRHAELFRAYGKKPTKGVLLYGPPGCGKTMFGKAAASVLAQLHRVQTASFMSIKAPELQGMWAGQTEERIRQIFAYARAYKALRGHPLVVFIDEADAILPSRDGHAAWYQESNVATFLTEMDGIEDSGALVILATNRPEAIDAAILRDGRIDRKIRVERPTRAAAAMIVERALMDVPLATPTIASFGDPPMGEMSGTGEPYRPTPVEWARGELAMFAAHAVFAPEQIVAQLATDQGSAFVRLSDIVNGAMLVGLVEQAKGNAFRRDLAVGGTPTGLTREDLDQAVLSIVAQNRGLNHAGVIQEIAARDGFSVAKVIAENAQPPRYTVDENDNVVRMQ